MSANKLEHEIRKAQINRESVVAVFFDIEKAYDMMWREGLLIKLCKLGIKGQMDFFILFFMNGTFILAAGRCDVTRPRRAALSRSG